MPAHRFRPSRRTRIAAFAAAGTAILAASATTLLASGDSAYAGSLTGTFYKDPSSKVLQWLAANPNDSRAQLIRDRIASQPQGRWFASWNPSTIQSEVSGYVSGANNAGQIPLAIVYEIPNRDCGGASAGGAPDQNQYKSWIDSFATGLGTRTAVVLLEPDSVSLTTCLSSTDLSARNASLSYAVSSIKSHNPSAKVYLDGGHSAWNSAGDQANRLVAAGVRGSDGFYTNVSNFRYTADEVAYGRNVLSSIGGSNLHQVVDVSRNGKGPNGSEWCDPAGRGVGVAPTTNTGESTVDAFVWAKPPGEADGCAAAAGTFVPDQAYQLALNGVVSSPPPSASASASASPSRSASPSASPSSSPSASPSRSPSASPSSSPTAGTGCSVAYHVDNQWNNGFTATVTITNRGSAPIAGWTLKFAFTGNQAISNGWNATVTQSGTQVTAKDAGWNGTIAVNGTASFGFQATFSGTNGTPTAYTVNGAACA
ncbi:glycoside hydrolase family 6 protein [Hamadaea tsunoensis]|uniref:glycoside hydrolase family 6 protein n=1 Tax=Hamadaea tsunoensis TaxID=53368 RepID=UPI000421E4E9|nr:glycoside hydrolase family 6 protein [Hamadaea tsunoensis]